jgi:hypothetical protein
MLHPLALVASYVFLRLRNPEQLEDRSPKRGAIALPPDEESAPQGGAGVAGASTGGNTATIGADRGAQEVDAEAIWG